MTKPKIALLMTGSALFGMLVSNLGPARAQFGDLLKSAVGGVVTVAVVDKFAPQINSFVNSVSGTKTDDVRESTKVVPILSIGQGTYVGAVQVTGPKNLVDQVKAVAELTAKKRVGVDVQVTALIPVSARSVTDLGSISRVKGVGVSAILDLRL